ncbi:PAS domain S-box-containing protein [Cnuella takakiae]|uniref:histidine kinase n=1 Tax=Cnuella takakiae TaxID=1302690 RepID=A0A1M4ZB94_9BACT|nr:PAS domain-containing protein [Cnuella takakiae]SHF15042.1 PAS domain S-box-containing protein [Cnuella takakiae]
MLHSEKQASAAKTPLPWEDPLELFAQWPGPAVVVSGPNFIIELVSSLLLRIWNCPLEEVLHQPYFEARKGKALAGLEQAFQQVYTQAQPLTWGVAPVAYPKDGGIIHAVHRIEITPFINESNQVTGAVAIGHDITNEILAQQRAEEKKQLTQHILDSSPDCVKIMELDGSLKYVNEKGVQLLELDDFATIEGKSWQNLLPPAGQQIIDQAVQKAAQGEKVQFTSYCPTLRGNPRWWDVLVAPVTNGTGAITGIISVSRDITERIRSEQELSFRSLLLEAQLDNNPDAILLTTLDRKILMGNRQFEQMWGLPRGSLSRLSDADSLNMVQHQVANAAALQQHVEWLYANNSVCGIFEISFKDGRIIEQHCFPVIGPDGVCHARCWQCRDITTQRRQTAQLQESEERHRTLTRQLELMVNDRTAQLQDSLKHLQRSNEELQQFAHVTSHDLKEPLRKIKTFTSRLQLELQEKVGEQSMGHLQKIQHAASRMTAMIDGVLQYASLNEAEQPREPVDLAHILHDIRADLEVLIDERNAVLSLHCSTQVYGVPILIYQLLYNLINNSLKFARQGVPPQITIDCEPFDLEGEAAVKITVSDNGIGFHKDYAADIFKSFKRLHSKDRYEGTGLGLSLCKKIVEGHRGTISATSVEGAGAVFTIILPTRL